MTDSPALMSMLGTQMRYLSQRQTVLSQNIANIDTPGYKAMDLKKLDFSKMVEAESGTKLAMSATSPKHLGSATLSNVSAFKVEEEDDELDRSPNGNTVSLEDEMKKVSDSTTKYQESAALMRKYTQMLHTAVSNK